MFHDLLSFVSFYYMPPRRAALFSLVSFPRIYRGHSVICKRAGHLVIGIFLCVLIVRYLSVLYLSYYHVR